MRLVIDPKCGTSSGERRLIFASIKAMDIFRKLQDMGRSHRQVNQDKTKETGTDNSKDFGRRQYHVSEVETELSIINKLGGVGKHQYNVSVVQTESSIRNKLDTADNAYWLMIDENNFTINLVRKESSVNLPNAFSWPLRRIRR